MSGDKPKCSVPQCQKPVYARDLCSAHYQRFLKYGHPKADEPISKRGRNWKPKLHPDLENLRKQYDTYRIIAPSTTCRYMGCSKPVWSYGFCESHGREYERQLRQNMKGDD